MRPANLRSALTDASGVTAAIQQELQRQHVAGPFDSPPFPILHCSPLGAAPSLMARFVSSWICRRRMVLPSTKVSIGSSFLWFILPSMMLSSWLPTLVPVRSWDNWISTMPSVCALCALISCPYLASSGVPSFTSIRAFLLVLVPARSSSHISLTCYTGSFTTSISSLSSCTTSTTTSFLLLLAGLASGTCCACRMLAPSSVSPWLRTRRQAWCSASLTSALRLTPPSA